MLYLFEPKAARNCRPLPKFAQDGVQFIHVHEASGGLQTLTPPPPPPHHPPPTTPTPNTTTTPTSGAPTAKQGGGKARPSPHAPPIFDSAY